MQDKNDVVFFLGAGASIEAGVPDTNSFIHGKKEKGDVQGFIEYLKEKNKDKELKVLKIVLVTLQDSGHDIIDVELVLGTLSALNRKKDFGLVYFFDQETFKFKSKKERIILSELESLLKGFIRKNVVVDKSVINYLAPLIAFKPIDIFSVNYDTCIEMLCIKHKLTYTDGFDLYWNRELFDSDKFDIKLFKLHGSILWYSTNFGNFVKLLPKFDEKNYAISLITDEIAEPFIIYPMKGKLEYLEPVGSLTNKLQKKLKEAKLCIVVGYSFRDEDIKRIFFDSAKENEDLTLILISPNAGKRFDDLLRYRDPSRKIESPISERVVCLNYPFGSVLKNNYLYQIKNKIPSIYSTYLDAKAEVRNSGNTIKFKGCIDFALEVGHVYFIEKVFEKELGISPRKWNSYYNKEEQFPVSYKLAIFYFMNSDKKGKEYFEFLIEYLQDIIKKGQQYIDLNMKFNEEEMDEEGRKIKRELEMLKKESTFYLWWSSQSNLNTAISSCNTFIQKQLELNPRDCCVELLKPTSEACVTLIDIFKIRTGTKYKGSAKVDFEDEKVENEKIEDIKNGIENLSDKISKFVEFYM